MEINAKDHHTPTELTQLERVDKSVVRQLSQLRPWLSFSHILLEYVFIFSAILLVNMYWHPLLYVVAVMWIGARQHAFAILLHDASHYRILKNKTANDVVSESLLAFPLFVTVRGYRLSHLAHHRHMNTEYDPDWVSKETPEWVFPKTRAGLFFILFRLALGMNAFWMIRLIFMGGRPKGAAKAKINTRNFVIARVAYYIVLIATLTYFGWWTQYLLFWILPMFTWLQVILRIRSIAEHFGLDYDHTFTNARTTYPSVFDRLFVASKNVWYHLDHHLYPSIPFYNLPELHAELNKLETFRTKAHITKSYLGVLRECTSPEHTATTV